MVVVGGSAPTPSECYALTLTAVLMTGVLAIAIGSCVLVGARASTAEAKIKKKKKNNNNPKSGMWARRRCEDDEEVGYLTQAIVEMKKDAAEVAAAAGQLGELVRARLGWHGDALEDPRWIVPAAHMAAAAHLVRAPGAPAYAFAFRDAWEPHSKEDASRDLVLGVSSWKSDDVFHLGRPRADTKWQWEELPRLRSALRRAGARVGHVLVQCAPDELGAAATALERLANAPELAGWESASSELRMLVLIGTGGGGSGDGGPARVLVCECKSEAKEAKANPKKQKPTKKKTKKQMSTAAAASGRLTAEMLMPPLFKEYSEQRGPRAVLSAGPELVAALLQSDLHREGPSSGDLLSRPELVASSAYPSFSSFAALTTRS